MTTEVDVAIIGAGHAGLNAVKEVRKVTDRWLLINGGPLGTTCARIGCMPSKVAIHLADSYQLRQRLGRYGVGGTEQLQIDRQAAMEHVRDLRDTFVDLVLANTTDEMDEAHLVEGYAEFIDDRQLKVGDQIIAPKAVIIATGARSLVPADWEGAQGVLTVDSLFEQEHLPESIAVIGLGPIGLEIGQALHRLGIQVTGFERGERIAGIADPAVNRAAVEIFQREFPLMLGQEPVIRRLEQGFSVSSGEQQVKVEGVFFAIGRRAHLEPLRLERLGVPLDQQGLPQVDPKTLKLAKRPIYLAGDATGGIANLQRAAEQGRIAGWNAVHRRQRHYRSRVPMAIIFSEPNIAVVGRRWHELDQQRTAVVQQRFGPVGRALIMGQNRGLMRVYADRRTGRLIGASMVGPRCEHLAHLLSWAIESGMSVDRALDMPFYHPVIEEALQDALIELQELLRTGPKATAWRRLIPRPANA